MAWTKEQFIEFCNRCGVDHNKALKEGHVNLRARNATWTTLGTIKSKQVRKNRARRAVREIQDSFREPDQEMALEQEVCGQDEGMGCPAPRFRISIIGLRLRPIDPDNFTAGCKGIIDGLVASGIIEGDEWETVELTTSQRKVSCYQHEGTIIEIETLDTP